jgi:hypothetical protein
METFKFDVNIHVETSVRDSKTASIKSDKFVTIETGLLAPSIGERATHEEVGNSRESNADVRMPAFLSNLT